MGHITEAYVDSQGLSDKFAHLVTFAINLPTTIEGDAGYWSYGLNLVDVDKFAEGAESCSVERLEAFVEALEKIISIKKEL